MGGGGIEWSGRIVTRDERPQPTQEQIESFSSGWDRVVRYTKVKNAVQDMLDESKYMTDSVKKFEEDLENNRVIIHFKANKDNDIVQIGRSVGKYIGTLYQYDTFAVALENKKSMNQARELHKTDPQKLKNFVQRKMYLGLLAQN